MPPVPCRRLYEGSAVRGTGAKRAIDFVCTVRVRVTAADAWVGSALAPGQDVEGEAAHQPAAEAYAGEVQEED
jgi:hypothetical protein